MSSSQTIWIELNDSITCTRPDYIGPSHESDCITVKSQPLSKESYDQTPTTVLTHLNWGWGGPLSPSDIAGPDFPLYHTISYESFG